MKKYGWNRVRKGPAKNKRLSNYYVKSKSRRFSCSSCYVDVLKRQGYKKIDIIKFYKNNFGEFGPSNKAISMLYEFGPSNEAISMLYNSIYDHFDVDISEADTLILGELSCESDLDC